MTKKIYTAIGLMSGTSLDGVDAAMIETDGESFVRRIPGAFYTESYEDTMRDTLRQCLGRRQMDKVISLVERNMTLVHAGAVKKLLAKMGKAPEDIDLVGFHGQTVFHDPANHFTWQIGDGGLLAVMTGIDVINDFRTADMRAGGQGAPLLPLYHQALAHDLPKPVAILNLGGVGNVTVIYGPTESEIEAFDTGPGNALIDDWVKANNFGAFDRDGLLAAAGKVHQNIVDEYLADRKGKPPYFTLKPPKSLDRDRWTTDLVKGLSLEDGAATLTAFTVKSVARARDHFRKQAQQWYVTGGGRHNPVIMSSLRSSLGVPVGTVDDLGWDGDAMEAEGFAYLAVRAHLQLPLSVPGTTGVRYLTSGGKVYNVDLNP
jgi:anhydro-N-acetylmuramic acid kinase